MLAAIGRVTLYFSLLDHVITLFISSSVPMSMDATNEMHSKYLQSAATRVWLLEQLWTPKSQDLAAFKALIARINTINTARNRFIHDIWTMSQIEPETALRVRLGTMLDQKQGVEAGMPYTLEEIDKFSSDIVGAAIELCNLLYPKIFGEPSPLSNSV